MAAALGIYLLGLVIGVTRIDGSPVTRVGLALIWPVGPLAFGATIAGLVLASLIAFPVVGAVVTLTLAALGWVALR
jgi:hypothetical protein